MKFLNKFTVVPHIPERFSRLKELAENLWWTWNYDAQELFERIDPELWEEVKHNPIVFLKKVSQKKLDEAAKNTTLTSLYDYVMEKFDSYMNSKETWFRKTHSKYKEGMIAYFCAEYGFHESFPIYSGGLGVLAGDHIKTASDLGIPLIGIGLLYRQGYFEQRINSEGWQENIFLNYDFADFPVKPAKDKDGFDLYITIDLLGKKVFAKVWELNVGRVKVYFLDTDIPQNEPEFRQITYQLYGGDQEMRIKQEILLGIGGVRAIRALGYDPLVWHMNEGHSAFLGLERIREYVQNHGLTFKEAIEVVRAGNVFTTHTPVPAGHDRFPIHLMEKYFSDYWPQLKANRHEFLDLGLEIDPSGNEMFNMTFLALKLSSRYNGVSKLHGQVSRKLLNPVWKGLADVEVPISHITNGVHPSTWISPDLQALFNKYFGKDWQEKIDDPDIWKKIEEIPDQELWAVHKKMKKRLIKFIHSRLRSQRSRHGETVEQLEEVSEILDENALTIGFARRFATYKRATLIFRDLERLKKIFNDPDKPVQIIFAGKAHPADRPGQELIKRIYEISRMPEFKNKVVILENYDMNMARLLVSGVDIWLNNPRRPYEASGTSGQKAAMNGAINFSVLDGWWVEGFNGKNGWAIGDEREYKDLDLQDNIDSVSLYNTLEKEIIPLYYNKSDDISKEWIEKMKESIKSVASYFNTYRMLKEYNQRLYMPAAEQHEKFTKDDFKVAKSFSKWRELLEQNWDSIKIRVVKAPDFSNIMEAGSEIDIEAEIEMPGIGPDSVIVQIVVAKLEEEKVVSLKTRDMKVVKETQRDTYLYRGKFVIEDRGIYGFNVRVLPYHPFMPYQHYIMGLVKYPGE